MKKYIYKYFFFNWENINFIFSQWKKNIFSQWKKYIWLYIYNFNERILFHILSMKNTYFFSRKNICGYIYIYTQFYWRNINFIFSQWNIYIWTRLYLCFCSGLLKHYTKRRNPKRDYLSKNGFWMEYLPCVILEYQYFTNLLNSGSGIAKRRRQLPDRETAGKEYPEEGRPPHKHAGLSNEYWILAEFTHSTSNRSAANVSYLYRNTPVRDRKFRPGGPPPCFSEQPPCLCIHLWFVSNRYIDTGVAQPPRARNQGAAAGSLKQSAAVPSGGEPRLSAPAGRTTLCLNTKRISGFLHWEVGLTFIRGWWWGFYRLLAFLFFPSPFIKCLLLRD